MDTNLVMRGSFWKKAAAPEWSLSSGMEQYPGRERSLQ